MKERSEIGIRSGLLESFAERLSSDCPSTLSAILSSVIGVMVTSVSEGGQRLRSDLIPSLLVLSSVCSSFPLHPLLLPDLVVVWLNSMQTVLYRHQPHARSESSDLDLLPTLLVLDQLCSGLKKGIKPEESKTTSRDSEKNDDSFSLTRRCGFALALIEKAVLVVKKAVEGQPNEDKKTLKVQDKIGGMLVRHFSSSIHSSQKEIGEIGINMEAARREMEKRENERERTAKKAEEERQREFSRKMREIEAEREKEKRELEEMKRELERKRKEEEELRRMNQKGAAAIEVYQQDKYALAGNVFTKLVVDYSSLFSISFGPVVVRISIIVRHCGDDHFHVGLISADTVEQAIPSIGYYSNLDRGASWEMYQVRQYVHLNKQIPKHESVCKAVADGQRVDADLQIGLGADLKVSDSQ
ncbi:hypothetical protein BLNAU_16437 [Blattamonas nauphoetae]|uniref:Uncharacterized protein n=1 Tax=Blattamonas nauphoetae TaxID=2049346 RepID=A0ABQ9XBH8_9EUKA|nr:hypothetical protein BLNAU_16437 [Blattamonas nauphoetae]